MTKWERAVRGSGDVARRTFDVRLVMATLDYLRAAGEGAAASELPEIADRSFTWVKRELDSIRAAARLEPRPLVFTEADCSNSFRMFEEFFAGWFGSEFKPGAAAPRLVPLKVGQRLRFRAGREYLDKVLSHACVMERYRLVESGVRRVFVPQFERASHCVAYAIAVIMENRWGTADRMRVCPFRQAEGDGLHLFIDLLPDGSVRPGRSQEFCTKQHGDTYRKRLQRAEEKAT